MRFLPDFDNLILGHDDRSRIVDPAHKARLMSKNLLIPGTVLVDGTVAATWSIVRRRGVATLTVSPFARLTRDVRRAVETEGQALVRFAEPDARDHAVEVADDG